MKFLTYLNAVGLGCGLAGFTLDVSIHASWKALVFDVFIAAANLFFVMRDCGTKTEEN